MRQQGGKNRGEEKRGRGREQGLCLEVSCSRQPCIRAVQRINRALAWTDTAAGTSFGGEQRIRCDGGTGPRDGDAHASVPTVLHHDRAVLAPPRPEVEALGALGPVRDPRLARERGVELLPPECQAQVVHVPARLGGARGIVADRLVRDDPRGELAATHLLQCGAQRRSGVLSHVGRTVVALLGAGLQSRVDDRGHVYPGLLVGIAATWIDGGLQAFCARGAAKQPARCLHHTALRGTAVLPRHEHREGNGLRLARWVAHVVEHPVPICDEFARSLNPRGQGELRSHAVGFATASLERALQRLPIGCCLHRSSIAAAPAVSWLMWRCSRIDDELSVPALHKSSVRVVVDNVEGHGPWRLFEDDLLARVASVIPLGASNGA
mmetsp:Transcript_13543/g.38023  ORF Transcript_13543/g.38023 Transcript_13543/m.38023 type:complete len:380 (-) Transcript_13543:699-1838(-)